MNYVKYLTYTNIYNSICSGLYSTYILLSYIPSYLPSHKKGVSPEAIGKTIDKLKNIQNNIKDRINHIDEHIEEFLSKSKIFYKNGNKRSAIYNLKLKKMYEREKEKLDSINFNIETQIFSIESMDLIIVTAETLKDTSLHMKSLNTTLDIDKIESTMEELQDHSSINEELQNIFSESISLDFNDEELLEELELLNDIKSDNIKLDKIKSDNIEPNNIELNNIEPNNIEGDNQIIIEKNKLKELNKKLPLPPTNNNNQDDPLNPPAELVEKIQLKKLENIST